jgi:hypothetical protein
MVETGFSWLPKKGWRRTPEFAWKDLVQIT